jgi:dienelactone hydrolase
MHRCSGIHNNARQWAGILKSKGYAVILPDSFAIESVIKTCDSASKRKKSKKLVRISRKLRKIEIHTAL